MDKKPYSVRLEPELLDKVKNRADQDNETVTAIFEQALQSFLSAPKDKPGTSVDEREIAKLRGRIERLEVKFHKLKEDDKHQDISFNKPEVQDKPNRPDPIRPEEAGELVTIKQISAITGYSKTSLSAKLSRAGIQVVERVNGNRAGLYSKKEVLDKIGYK